MNLYKIVLYPLILSSSAIGRIFMQQASDQKTSYPPECNKINFNAGYGSNKREHLNYNNKKDFGPCIPAGYKASVDCGMVRNLIIGCKAIDAPRRPPSFDDECAKHMIEKGRKKFQYVSEIQGDPCLNKYKDNSFYPIGSASGTMADKAANRKGKVISF